MQIRNHSRLLAVVLSAALCLNASEQHGTVKFGGLPVPGATVTATQGDKKLTIITDQQGAYSFPDLADGSWNIEVDMLCFATIKQDVTVAAGAPASEWELKLLPLDEIKATAVAAPPPPPLTGVTVQTPESAQPAAADNKSGKNAPAAGAGNGSGGFRRTDVNATSTAPPASGDTPPPTSDAFAGQSAADLNKSATDGLLINGSTNNAASSPFALSAPFGNNRRGARSLYNGSIGLIIDNSSFDAENFSVTGQNTPKPSYTHMTGVINFGGPIKIPHVVRNGPNLFVNYQWTRNRNSSVSTGLMPTAAERDGDFAGVLGPNGQPVELVNPANGQQLGNMIPTGLISPQANALLKYYPLPNFTGSTVYNYQIPIVANQHVDSLQSRTNKGIGRKNQVYGGAAFTSTRGDTPNIFGFLDTTTSLGLAANANWRHQFTNRLSGVLGYNFSRQSATATPFFANRENVSGEAGITGNLQNPQNWGPPTLAFGSSGIQPLSDGTESVTHNQTGAVSYSMQWNRGRHNVQYGSDFKKQEFNTIGQQNPRGTFQFTGAAAGDDFAGFLLGVPDASAIAFNPKGGDKYLRDNLYDAYITDDWRISPGFTLNAGVRWEYNAPITELYGRLVNLDVAPDFTAVAPVVAYDPIGPLTGQHYPDSLVQPDKHAFMPRIAISWRPLPASSLVVRAGYGIYYNTSVYQSIANQMSQQSPLSTSFSIANSAANPLTLANGFTPPAGVTTNTFAIDPNFRVGYTNTWQVSVARDLPGALVATATYLGIKGTRNVQEFYPNTYPVGGVNPCATCPSGFAYLTSNGDSTREAGTLQLRRRLHNGFSSSLQYTYSKSIDDSALGGGSQIGTLIAQNWQDLSAERGLSTFDQRNVFNITGQYTSGMGIGGGTLLSGWRGALAKEWTITTTIVAGSGLPLTPKYAEILPGTGVINVLRPDYTGAAIYDAQPGLFLNPLAFTAPVAGEFGDAGRDSITGPYQFSLNGQLGRTFRISDRMSLDFRLDLTNALNHVVFTSWNTTLGPQFGAPVGPNGMRTVLTTVRLRF
jgi:trimeric autotransporter adhesin